MIEPVDAQERNRLLAEGDIRLRRFREALKSNPNRPKDWEEITPAQLKPAIKHLVDEFKSQEFQLTHRAQAGCYLALHPGLAMETTFKGGFTNPIPLEKRAAWRQFYVRATEPAIFKFWCDQLADSLIEVISTSFAAFLKIGLAQRASLPLEPVEWTKVLARGVLYSLEWTLPTKIKGMCDEQKNRRDFANEYFFAYSAWVYWRAPRFVHMHPSGNTLYDPETAWEREDEEETESLLHGLTERIVDPARFKVDDLAGQPYVSLASTPPAEPQSQLGSTPDQRNAARDGAVFPSIEPRTIKELPAKERDLSNYFDQAQLTDRQRSALH